MQPAPPIQAPIRASVVIAVLDEGRNVGPVCEELAAKLAPLAPYEVVFVDDGSTDDTAARIAALCRQRPEFRLLRHDRRCGKSAALRTGVGRARAPWVATMDGDGQNDPADVVGLLELGWAAGGPAPLVAGVRVGRQDTASKRLASRLANRLRRAVLADDCPDTGCGLKAFRRDDFLELPSFEGMHRFLPALFRAYGHPLLCRPVADRARLAGQSKYTNLGRALVGVGDLLGVVWLRRRTRLPGRVTEG
jgi:dolichol-phosphate mannosyltransferase